MQLIDKGEYRHDEACLLIKAQDDHSRYTLHIDRKVFEQQFGATATGRFHEYMGLVFDNRQIFEQIAARKLAAGEFSKPRQIDISNADF